MEGPADRSGVVVGFDGSAHAMQALDWALDEAELRRSPLILCHAWQWPYGASDELGRRSLRMAANHVLEHGVECARYRTGGVQVASTLCEGPAVRRLAEMSTTAELLIVGSRGLGDFARLAVGSVGEQVAAHASCPVVVIRGAGPLPRPETPRPLAVGVVDSPGGRAALGFAAREALLRGLPLHVLHACGEPGLTRALGPSAASAGDRLNRLVDLWRDRHPDLDLRPCLIEEHARTALLTAAEGAGLLVLGRSRHHRSRLGSIGRWMLHHVACPVAVVPTAGEPGRR
jgi:nucleotide-binding universal stress UspA family protein